MKSPGNATADEVSLWLNSGDRPSRVDLIRVGTAAVAELLRLVLREKDHDAAQEWLSPMESLVGHLTADPSPEAIYVQTNFMGAWANFIVGSGGHDPVWNADRYVDRFLQWVGCSIVDFEQCLKSQRPPGLLFSSCQRARNLTSGLAFLARNGFLQDDDRAAPWLQLLRESEGRRLRRPG